MAEAVVMVLACIGALTLFVIFGVVMIDLYDRSRGR